MGKSSWCAFSTLGRKTFLNLGLPLLRLRDFLFCINWGSVCLLLVFIALVSIFSMWKWLAGFLVVCSLVHCFLYVDPVAELMKCMHVVFFVTDNHVKQVSSVPGSPTEQLRRVLSSLVLAMFKKSDEHDVFLPGSQQSDSVSGDYQPNDFGNGLDLDGKRCRSISFWSDSDEDRPRTPPVPGLFVDTSSGRDSPGYGHYVTGSPSPENRYGQHSPAKNRGGNSPFVHFGLDFPRLDSIEEEGEGAYSPNSPNSPNSSWVGR